MGRYYGSGIEDKTKDFYYPGTENKIPAYLYLREEENNSRSTIAEKKDSWPITRFAREEGYYILSEYREESDSEDFKAFREMMSTAYKGGRPNLFHLSIAYREREELCPEDETHFDNVTTVIIEDVKKLFPDSRIQQALINHMIAHGLTVISAQNKENVTKTLLADPINRIFFSLHQALFGELAEIARMKKLAEARDRVREMTGKCEGPPSYSEAMPEVIKEIKRLRRKRKGIPKRRTYGEIADILNASGMKTMKGKQFTAQIVGNILNRIRRAEREQAQLKKLRRGRFIPLPFRH